MLSFFDRLSSLLSDDMPKAEHGDLQLAVGALLVVAATRDDMFVDEERTTIERLLAERFELPPDKAAQLVAASEAESATSLQMFGYVRKIMEQMDEADRVKLVEMLWEVAYADGVLDPHEDALIRRVAGLIYVSDFDRGAARRRVREKLGLGA